MKSSPVLEFTSTAFEIAPGEDEATNPGIFGKSLATWLAQQLPAHGVNTGEVIAEDFGWVVELESKPHRLYLACSSVEETTDTWRLYVFAEGGLIARLFGKDQSAASVAAAYAAVKKLLEGSGLVQNLREDEI